MKMTIKNFKTIEDRKLVIPENKVCYLAGKNGDGKSSVLEAFRFGLTKVVPENALRNNNGVLSVSMNVNGYDLCREQTKEGVITTTINGKKPKRMSDINAVVGDVSAIDISTSRTFDHMTSQELADFLLARTKDKPSLETIISFMENPTDEWIAYFKENTEKEKLELSDIQKMYKKFYTTRTEWNRVLKQKLEEVSKPTRTVKEINESLTEIGKKEEAQKMFLKEQKQYEDALKGKKQIDVEKETIQKELLELQKYVDETTHIKEVKEHIERGVSGRNELLQNISVLENNVKTFEKTLISLKGNTCPFSDKIICNTDKSSVVADIEKQSSDNEKQIFMLKKKVEEYSDGIKRLQEKELQLEKAQKLFEKKKLKEQELERISKVSVKVPEKPTPVQFVDYSKEKVQLEKEQKQIFSYEKYLEKKKEKDTAEKMVKMLNYLLSQTEPKGPVYKKMIQYYLKTFEDCCNTTAGMIKEDIKVKLLSKDGIKVFFRMGNGKCFLPFNNLSAGEKTIANIIMIDLVNQITNSHYLVLDEVNVLDEQNIENIIQFFQSDYVKAYYKYILLAMTEETGNKMPNTFVRL